MIVSYSLVPLRLLTVVGMVLTLLGIYSVAEMVVRDVLPLLSDPSDLEQLTSITLFFRGFQLLATGILGEYVGRIYLKLRQDPQYIIREKLSARQDWAAPLRPDHG